MAIGIWIVFQVYENNFEDEDDEEIEENEKSGSNWLNTETMINFREIGVDRCRIMDTFSIKNY